MCVLRAWMHLARPRNAAADMSTERAREAEGLRNTASIALADQVEAVVQLASSFISRGILSFPLPPSPRCLSGVVCHSRYLLCSGATAETACAMLNAGIVSDRSQILSIIRRSVKAVMSSPGASRLWLCACSGQALCVCVCLYQWHRLDRAVRADVG